MKKILILFFLILIVVLGYNVWYTYAKQAPEPNSNTKENFVIKKGEGVRDIGYALKNQGLIKDSVAFFIYVKLHSLDSKIEAGNFTLSPNQDLESVIATILHGTSDFRITFPEGLRAEEIAQILEKNMPTYNTSWNKILDANEGYLFPDTYLFSKDSTINQIITIMKNNFKNKYAIASANATVKLSQKDAVILASIVQREAITPNDMRQVASVLENRLNIGMPLGSDVTLEYALGYQPSEKTWWKKVLTALDLQVNSPYNTRLNAGLPPTPISNPGLVALEAVLNPAKTNYLYYLSDNNGKLHFATTLEQHNANIAKYLGK